MAQIIGTFALTGYPSLIAYDAEELETGDGAIVFTDSGTLFYTLRDSGEVDDGDNILTPSGSAGTKRWLKTFSVEGISNIITPVTGQSIITSNVVGEFVEYTVLEAQSNISSNVVGEFVEHTVLESNIPIISDSIGQLEINIGYIILESQCNSSTNVTGQLEIGLGYIALESQTNIVSDVIGDLNI